MKKKTKKKASSRKKARVKDLTSRKSPRGGLAASTYGRGLSANPAKAGNTIGSSLGTDKILNP
ncbi:MAG: hypothetical protein ACRDQ2_16950 [Gaiellales bacterium]